MAPLGKLAVCAFAVALYAAPGLARQSGGQSGSTPGWPLHNSAPDHAMPDPVVPLPPVISDTDESCILWTVTRAQAPTISTATMQVPGKAKGEYRKGCADLRGKKLESAESHLRKAVEEYPRYAMAWVLLGQLMDMGNQAEEARRACSQASSVDANYAPAYLCLADVASQSKKWSQTLDLAERALELDPLENVYGYFYSAMAEYHLVQLPEAEKSALQTIAADRLHRLPQAHLLLAEICAARQDFKGEAAQLRAFLKVAPKSADSDGVRKSLAELETQISK